MQTSQVAKDLGVSPATVRLWCSKFQTAIPIFKDAGGRWIYTPGVIDTFANAKEALRSGYTFDQVAGLIERGDLQEVRPSTATLTATIEEQGAKIDYLTRLVVELISSVKALPERNSAPIAALEQAGETAYDPSSDADTLNIAPRRWWSRKAKL